MPKKLTTEEWIEKARKFHGDKYDYSKVEYVRTKEKVIIGCSIHGEFLQAPNDHLNGCGCARCSGRHVPTTEEFIKSATQVHGNEYDYSKINYTASKNYVIIKCKIHGEFLQTPDSHLNGRQGCPKCARNYISTTKEWIEKAKKIHGNKYDCSKVNYVNNKIPVTIICKTHGEFVQTPNSHLAGRGCKLCGCEKIKLIVLLRTDEFIEKAKKIHGDKYDYSVVNYTGVRIPVIIKCKIHGEFLQTPNNHMRGKGCRKCTFSVSNKETKFLDLINISEENRQKKIGKYLVDAYVPKIKTVYEFLGDFWHGNPKIYKSGDANRVNKRLFGNLYEETISKFSKLKNLGYNVKYIWENDWDNWIKNRVGEIPIQEYL